MSYLLAQTQTIKREMIEANLASNTSATAGF